MKLRKIIFLERLEVFFTIIVKFIHKIIGKVNVNDDMILSCIVEQQPMEHQ